MRQRPRVVITPDGFALDKLFGSAAHRWEDVDGRFVVLEVGWNKVVAYNLTADYKARVGKKPTSSFSGYDAVIADALADAGCGEPAIAEHCLGPGPHAPGCWVIDLVLAAE